jgi:16S rRNA (uracil1498-N3)-methyltransferase
MTDRAPRFLIETLPAIGDTLALSAAERHHVRVLRLAPGARLELFDGNGNGWDAELELSGDRLARAHVVAKRPSKEGESQLELALAVGVLKSDRLEWLIEKATELGVRRIVPFTSEHSVSVPSANRTRRWRQIAAAAAKQCRRSRVPDVEAPIDIERALSLPYATKVLLCERDTPNRIGLPAVAVQPRQVLIAVGPEGGFAPAEIEAARAAHCRLVDLGARTLRAETAAVTAAALCQMLWGDLHPRHA